MPLSKIDIRIIYGLYAAVPVLAVMNIPMYKAGVSLAFMFAFIYYYRRKFLFKKISKLSPMLFWLALNMYHVTNGIIKGVPEVDYVDYLHGFRTYTSMCISCYFGCLCFGKFIDLTRNVFYWKALLIAGGIILTSGLSGRLTGAGYSATGVGQCASQCGIFLSYSYALGLIDKKKMVMMFVIPFSIVFLSQSRNSLATIMMSIITVYIVDILKYGRGVRSKDILVLCFGIVLAYIAMHFFQQSDFGQRVQRVNEMYEDGSQLENYGTGTFFDTIVGDRLVYYVRGWDYFLENPWTGIGYRNYRYVTGGTYPLHSEYMIHICEGGVFAICLWLRFQWCNIKKWYDSNADTVVKLVAASSYVIVMFCGIYAREFTGEQYACFYGIILSLYYGDKYKMYYQNS